MGYIIQKLETYYQCQFEHCRHEWRRNRFKGEVQPQPPTTCPKCGRKCWQTGVAPRQAFRLPKVVQARLLEIAPIREGTTVLKKLRAVNE